MSIEGTIITTLLSAIPSWVAALIAVLTYIKKNAQSPIGAILRSQVGRFKGLDGIFERPSGLLGSRRIAA